MLVELFVSGYDGASGTRWAAFQSRSPSWESTKVKLRTQFSRTFINGVTVTLRAPSIRRELVFTVGRPENEIDRVYLTLADGAGLD
jgi:hypothetical protein|tara:strand:- start:958 stop:1215 length:258 start_codon:yes stop_codon:yes gene_type:complete